MTRVNVVKRLRFGAAGQEAVWILVDSDTGQEITRGSKDEIHLRAKRVREIHERHEKDAADGTFTEPGAK